MHHAEWAALALGAGGLQPGTAYCVGGIVDRTVKGDQTKDWAARHRLQTAHLPIREHLPGVNPSQTVLNVNAVVDVLPPEADSAIAMLGALVGAVGCCCDKGDAVKNACGMTKDHMMALGALVGALCC